MNHIKYEEGAGWCGATLDNSFHFKDIDQAIINNFHGERLICRGCLRSVVAAILTIAPVAQLTQEAHQSILEDYSKEYPQ